MREDPVRLQSQAPMDVPEVSHVLELLENAWEQGRDILSTAPVSTAQIRVMYIIEREPGINLSTLRRHLDVGAPSTTRLCDRLQAAGFLRRTPRPEDRRETQLQLTDSRHRALARDPAPPRAGPAPDDEPHDTGHARRPGHGAGRVLRSRGRGGPALGRAASALEQRRPPNCSRCQWTWTSPRNQPFTPASPMRNSPPCSGKTDPALTTLPPFRWT